MSKRRQEKAPSHASATELAWVVREGKSCSDKGQAYLPGAVFPLDDLPLELQNLHLPNLERIELPIISPEEISPGPLTPEETVEVIDQETESPHAYDDALL